MEQSELKSTDLAESKGEEVIRTEGWVDAALIHTAETAGDLYITTATGKVSEGSSSFNLPRNVPLKLRFAPETRVNAMSVAGSRRINIALTPVPMYEELLERVGLLIDDLSCFLHRVTEK